MIDRKEEVNKEDAIDNLPLSNREEQLQVSTDKGISVAKEYEKKIKGKFWLMDEQNCCAYRDWNRLTIWKRIGSFTLKEKTKVGTSSKE